MIRMQNAGFAYDGRTVLRGLNLHIRPGEFVAVAGPNGAGKTSFAKLLNGLNRRRRARSSSTAWTRAGRA